MREYRFPVPEHDGEILLEPSVAGIRRVIAVNRSARASWGFTVGDLRPEELALLCRTEIAALKGYAGLDDHGMLARVRAGEPVIMSGHQPELFHSGIWIKNFLLGEIADRLDIPCVNLAVDTDVVDGFGAMVPATRQGRRVREALTVGENPGSPLCLRPAPAARAVESFLALAEADIESTGARGLSERFALVEPRVRAAAEQAHSLAEFGVRARHALEDGLAAPYAEVPVSGIARGAAFLTYVADIVANSRRFADSYNAALDAFRSRNKTRSPAQPFPNLKCSDEEVELPFWVVRESVREPLAIRDCADRVVLVAGDTELCSAVGEPVAIRDALVASGAFLAPKAVALSLFVRMFACDAFIHGLGGARYDEVTDALCAKYYRVEAPGLVVATATFLIAELQTSTPAADVASLRQELHRLEHNPDALARSSGRVPAEVAQQVAGKAAEKAELVEMISREGADRKRIGLSIKQLNAEMSALLDPVRAQIEQELLELEAVQSEDAMARARDYTLLLHEPARLARAAAQIP